jgi:hypothetical protein
MSRYAQFTQGQRYQKKLKYITEKLNYRPRKNL